LSDVRTPLSFEIKQSEPESFIILVLKSYNILKQFEYLHSILTNIPYFSTSEYLLGLLAAILLRR